MDTEKVPLKTDDSKEWKKPELNVLDISDTKLGNDIESDGISAEDRMEIS
ncbi:MAG: paeninodin family lasso peptide [Bacteroidetes bacterium]|jgi:hypothetical protein|nr:paeninodin family lasso peptide [Bacteroidota bacterium]